ncbi:MAG: O-antigen translocase [Myxococcales bacterium]|nr:O-antigen translocase [Myxococcales bacterium]
MSLLRTSALAAVSTAIKVSTAFISVKAIAWFAGPEGLAKLGQLSNVISVVTIVAGGGIFGGVTKYVAEYRAAGKSLGPLVATSVALILACSVGAALLLGGSAWFVAAHVLGDGSYWQLILLLALLTGFVAGNNLLTSLLNGHKDIGRLTRVNVTTSLAGVVLTVALVWAMGVQGALLALIVTPVATFLGAVLLVRRTEWWPLLKQRPRFDRGELKGLSRFTAMSVTTAVCGPVAMIVLRDYLAAHASWQEVGYWQGVWKISEVYLMVATLSISTYFLPRLSELKDPAELRREILQGYKTLLPLVALTAAGIFVFRTLLIRLLFAPGFEPMEHFFLFQLIGDFFKIGSWVVAHLMLAKATTRLFIISEIVFSGAFVGWSLFFVKHFGAVGVTYAFALNYLTYWIFMAWVFRDYLVAQKRSPAAAPQSEATHG